MYNKKELSTYQICRRYAQPQRLELRPLLVTSSHNEQYNQASAADPQLYVAMASLSKQRIRDTNQDVIFLLSSEKRDPATICHSQA
jgi:hypothetical protein